MILSDQSLKDLIKEKKLVIDPLDESAIQPASVDFRLGRHYLQVEDRKMSTIYLDKKVEYREFVGDEIVLPPQSFLLATTKESVKIPHDVTAFVEGRSSIGRIGLFIQNAGWVDPGFEGQITLEFYNANSLPICLKADRRICQLVFCKMDQKTLSPYKGKYTGQKNATGTLIFKDKEIR